MDQNLNFVRYCKTRAHLKGFVEYNPSQTEENNSSISGSDDSSTVPTNNPEEESIPGFGINLSILSLLGATVVLRKKNS